MTAGSIIAGGFGLVRQRPGAVAIWGLLYIAVTALTALAMRPIMGSMAQVAGGGATSPDAADTMAMAMSRLMLVEIAVFAVAIVLFAAAQRAVLHPEREAFAYLRLGMDELRLIGLAVGLVVLFYIGLLVATLVIALVVALVAVAAGMSAAIPVIVIAVLALLGVTIWLEVRLSLAFPLTLLRGKIVVAEAWRATRGRFWTLFLAFLALFLLLLVLWIAAALVTSGGYFADLASFGFTPEGFQRASERQMERQLGAITPAVLIGWLASGVAGSLSIAVFGGAVAAAAREVVTDVEGLADTFA